MGTYRMHQLDLRLGRKGICLLQPEPNLIVDVRTGMQLEMMHETTRRWFDNLFPSRSGVRQRKRQAQDQRRKAMRPKKQVRAPHPGKATPPPEGYLTLADPHVEFAHPSHLGKHSVEEFTRDNATLKVVLRCHTADNITTIRKQGRNPIMADKRVSIRLSAEGGRQVRAELTSIGAAGAEGFGRVSREASMPSGVTGSGLPSASPTPTQSMSARRARARAKTMPRVSLSALDLSRVLGRPQCSFRPPGVRRPRGFSLPMLNVGGAGYRSR